MFLFKFLYLDVRVTLLNGCLSGMLMKLVTAWDPVGENQFVLKEECKKCYAGKKYLGILSGQAV